MSRNVKQRKGEVVTLSEALDTVYGHTQWYNPIRPCSVSGVYDTPYQAFKKLKPEYKEIVVRLIGHQPVQNEDSEETVP